MGRHSLVDTIWMHTSTNTTNSMSYRHFAPLTTGAKPSDWRIVMSLLLRRNPITGKGAMVGEMTAIFLDTSGLKKLIPYNAMMPRYEKTVIQSWIDAESRTLRNDGATLWFAQLVSLEICFPLTVGVTSGKKALLIR